MENLCRLLTKKDIIKLMTDYNKYLYTKAEGFEPKEEEIFTFQDLEGFAKEWTEKHIKPMSLLKHTFYTTIRFILPVWLRRWGLKFIFVSDNVDTIIFLGFYTLMVLQEFTFTSFFKFYEYID